MDREDVKKLENYKKQKQKAERKGDLKEEALYCSCIGELYQQYDKYPEAVEEFKHALSLYESISDPLNIAVACRMLGECYSKQGNVNRALQLHTRYLDLAKECHDLKEEQRALTTLGRTYLEQYFDAGTTNKDAALQKAESSFQRSFDVCKQLDGQINQTEYQDMKARLYYNLGLVYEYRNDMEKSIKNFRQSASIGQTYQLHEILYLSQCSLAESQKRVENLAEALRYLDLAMGTARKLRNKKYEKEALFNKSMVLVQQNDFSASRHLLKKVRQLGHQDDEEMDKLKQSYRTVVKMQKTLTEIRDCEGTDNERLIKLYDRLGDLAVDLGAFKMAISHYQKVLDYSKLAGKTRKELIPTHVSLAETYNDDRQYDKAISHYKAEIECREGRELDQVCRSLLSIADIQERAGYNIGEIQQTYVNAYNTAKKANHRKLQVQSITLLTELFRVHKQEKLLKKAQAQLDHVLKKYNITENILEEESQTEDTSSLGDTDVTLTTEDLQDGGDDDEEEDVMSDLTESDEDEEKVEKVSNYVKVYKSSTGRVRRTNISKVNSYGETKLHEACIKNNLQLVKDLIAQGHALNPRDYNGWTPLHEAANHNHYEIAEYLLKHGANVNDRGGPGCRGLTPLIDAASNGQIQMMELLMKHGANVVAKDDDQKTALDHLVEFRDTEVGSSLTREEEVLYSNMVQKLRERGVTRTNRSGLSKLTTSALIPASESRPAASKRKRSDDVVIESDSSDGDRDEEGSGKRKTSRSRSPLETDSMETNDSDNFYLNPGLDDLIDDRSATDAYRNAISSVGKSASRSSQVPKQSSSQSRGKSKKPALLQEDAIVNDWLIDDLKTSKRQKVNGYFTTEGGARSSQTLTQRKRRKIESDSETDEMDAISNDNPESDTLNIFNDGMNEEIEDFLSDGEENNLRDITNFNSSAENQVVKDKNQVDSLFIDEDIEDLPPPATLRTTSSCRASQKNKPKQLKLTDFGQRTVIPSTSRNSGSSFTANSAAMSMTGNSGGQPISSQGEAIASTREKSLASVIRVKVQVQDKLLLIPVVDSDGTKTFGWLADEASTRYYKLCGLRPSLTLAKDGAHFSPEDLVSLLLMDNDKIDGYLQSWDLPPITERYSSACKTLNAVVYKNVSTLLQLCETTGRLNLEDLSLKPSRFQPVINTLQCQNNLRELNICGNRIGDLGLENLCKVLTSLPGLCTLGLACNDITGEGLKHLTLVLTAGGDKPLQQLSVLDLSHNPLYDNCLVSMATLVSHLPSLSQLSLVSCHLTVKLFQKDRLQLTEALHKSTLQTFDIYCNNLGCVGVELFLKCQNPTQLQTLNLSSTLSQGSAQLYRHLYYYLSQDRCAIQELILKDCHLGQENTDFLIRLPVVAKQLHKLDLSCNPRLTNEVLQQLLVTIGKEENCCLEELCLTDCGLQSPLDVELLDALSEKLNCSSPLRMFEFTCMKLEKIDVESLTAVWQEKWENLSDIQYHEQYIKLGVLPE